MTALATRALEESIRAHAYGLGFDLVGIATLGSMDTAPHFDRWLERGYAGEMHYLPKWADKRRDSRLPYEGVLSAIVVATNYGGAELSGPVARYARGDDYHDVLDAKLRELHSWLGAELGREIRGRAYVDTGPLLERDLARRAGLGWFGKNTNLINPKLGSFFFLGALLVDLELAPDEPFASDHCGTCTRCIEACPTGAIVEPRVLDATRCISYLTIEAKGEIPLDLREQIGELLYGCDICQDVCPWNEKFSSALPQGSPFQARHAVAGKDARTLARELLAMTQEQFSDAFRRSPMKRAKLHGLKRNAAVVLDNLAKMERMHIVEGGLDDPRVIELLHTHLLSATAETAPGSAHALDLSGLRASTVTFWSAWEDETPVGVGALKQLSADHGEVKSMHTVEAVRRRGIAAALLRHIVAVAQARGMSRVSLETGSWPFFAPARALYARHGFIECGPFGDYVRDPNSVFMTLALSPSL